jgi:hypothetical protein
MQNSPWPHQLSLSRSTYRKATASTKRRPQIPETEEKDAADEDEESK